MLRNILLILRLQRDSDLRRLGYEFISSLAAATIVAFVLSFSLSPVIAAISFESRMASRTETVTSKSQTAPESDSTFTRARGIDLSKADGEWDPSSGATPMISVSRPAEVRLNDGSEETFSRLHADNVLVMSGSDSNAALLDEVTANELNVRVGDYVGWVGAQNDFIIVQVDGLVRPYATRDSGDTTALLLLPNRGTDADQYFDSCSNDSEVKCGSVEFATVSSIFLPNKSTGVIAAAIDVFGSATSSVAGASGAMLFGAILWILVASRGSAARVKRFSFQSDLLASLGSEKSAIITSRLVAEFLIHVVISITAAVVAIVLLVRWALDDLVPAALLPTTMVVLTLCYIPLAIVTRSQMLVPHVSRVADNA